MGFIRAPGGRDGGSIPLHWAIFDSSAPAWARQHFAGDLSVSARFIRARVGATLIIFGAGHGKAVQRDLSRAARAVLIPLVL